MLSAFNIKMINFVNKLFGSSSKRHIKSFTKIVDKINEFEEKFKNLSDKELKDKTEYFKNSLGMAGYQSNLKIRLIS